MLDEKPHRGGIVAGNDQKRKIVPSVPENIQP